MKRFLLHIISLVFAVYFLMAGTGFNLINYCCNSCRSAGIEYVANNTCSDVHEHHHDACCTTDAHDEHEATSLTQEHAKSCSLYRFNVETPTVTTQTNNFPTEILKLHFTLFSVFNLLPTFQETELLAFKFPPSIIPTSGRSILSQKSVLVI